MQQRGIKNLTTLNAIGTPIPSRHEAIVDQGATAGDEIAIEARPTSSNPLDFVEVPIRKMRWSARQARQ